ncbi:MAG: RsmB/NOP family class I SAM-dependent RNA methyltransferase [bacterium]
MQLSPKKLRRQADVLIQILRDTVAAVEAGSPADATLASCYRQHPEFGSRDRRLFSETIFAYFRWKGWLTASLAPDLESACVLAHALEALEINDAVRLLAETTRLATVPLEPLGALDLSAKAAGLGRMTGTPPPSPLSLVPSWVPEMLRIPPETETAAHVLRSVAAFQTPPPTWLRARPDHKVRVAAALRSAGADPQEPDRLPDALSVPRGVNLRALSPQLRGIMEIQDLASQVTGLICAPRPGERWWDACCGSGGKTLHLSDLMQGNGRVLATDIRPGILESLERRLREAQISGVRTKLWDGLKDPLPHELFDGILVDAPCSGLGTWHRNPDARWRTSRGEVERLAVLQAELLAKCAQRVRPGGVLVYATCTLTQLENEGVLNPFLAAMPEFSLATFPHPLDGSPCTGQAWVYPWQASCNGMFVARLVRCTI